MNIHLDVTTLSFMSVVVMTILAALMWFLWHGHRDERATLLWALGMTGSIFAIGLVILRGQIHDMLSIAIANTMAIVTYCLFWWGNDEFFHRRPRYMIGGIALAVFFAFQVYFALLDPSLRTRVLIYTGACVAFGLACAESVTRRPEPGMRLQQLLLAGVFLMLTAFNIVRFYVTWRSPNSSEIFDPGPLNMLNFILPPLGAVVGAFAWALMVNQRLRARMADLIRQDALTRVLNRVGLDEIGQQEVARYLRHQKPLSVIIMDLDSFKALNDRHGHRAGDALLCEIVASVRDLLRREDHIGRTGGDELTLILPETPQDGAEQLAERVRRAVAAAQHKTETGDVLNSSGSVGLATLDDASGDMTWDQLLNRADAALHEAKRLGRNRVVVAPGDAGLTLAAML
ncbi:GGDEF domain-containing protein [Ferrovibrio sp. MS7]|uniref:GGDEF domain-containing protein n=1 Tax=Ferrovibrio plantarum TaxID=3119164 RepID=UPI003136356A